MLHISEEVQTQVRSTRASTRALRANSSAFQKISAILVWWSLLVGFSSLASFSGKASWKQTQLGASGSISDGGATPVLQTGHNMPVTHIQFGSNNQWLASADFNGILKLWEVESRVEIQTASQDSSPGRPGYSDLVMDPGSKWVAAVPFGGNGKASIIGIPNGQVTAVLPHSEGINKLAIDSVGRYLVGERADGSLLAWKTADWNSRLHLRDCLRATESHPIEGEDASAESYGNKLVAFSKDGTFVTSINMQGHVQRWRMSDGCLVWDRDLKPGGPSTVPMIQTLQWLLGVSLPLMWRGRPS